MDNIGLLLQSKSLFHAECIPLDQQEYGAWLASGLYGVLIICGAVAYSISMISLRLAHFQISSIEIFGFQSHLPAISSCR